MQRGVWGAYASSRVVFGVSPNRFSGGTPEIARGDACAPQPAPALSRCAWEAVAGKGDGIIEITCQVEILREPDWRNRKGVPPRLPGSQKWQKTLPVDQPSNRVYWRSDRLVNHSASVNSSYSVQLSRNQPQPVDIPLRCDRYILYFIRRETSFRCVAFCQTFRFRLRLSCREQV